MVDNPCDNQTRTWLDPVAPDQRGPVFAAVDDALEGAGYLSSWRVFRDQVLIALDGTAYLTSQEMHGERCSQRTHRHGRVTYLHQAITPVSVAPGRREVIPLAPECITPQDGHAKQDCAQVAAKRWIERHVDRSQQVTIVGDDRYCQQPFCALVLRHGGNFIVVCKPESHPTLSEWRAGVDAARSSRRSPSAVGMGGFAPSTPIGMPTPCPGGRAKTPCGSIGVNSRSPKKPTAPACTTMRWRRNITELTPAWSQSCRPDKPAGKSRTSTTTS